MKREANSNQNFALSIWFGELSFVFLYQLAMYKLCMDKKLCYPTILYRQ